MNSLIALWLIVLTGLGSVRESPPSKADRSDRSQPYRIVAIRARLFYEQSGTFSVDILSHPEIALWNVIIGEGSAKEPSNSTLVLVEVMGEPGAYAPRRKVLITARTKPVWSGPFKGRRTINVRRVITTGILGKDGKRFAPLWLSDTGCEFVTITARLLGQPTSPPVKRTIKFYCGE